MTETGLELKPEDGLRIEDEGGASFRSTTGGSWERTSGEVEFGLNRLQFSGGGGSRAGCFGICSSCKDSAASLKARDRVCCAGDVRELEGIGAGCAGVEEAGTRGCEYEVEVDIGWIVFRVTRGLETSLLSLAPLEPGPPLLTLLAFEIGEPRSDGGYVRPLEFIPSKMPGDFVGEKGSVRRNVGGVAGVSPPA